MATVFPKIQAMGVRTAVETAALERIVTAPPRLAVLSSTSNNGDGIVLLNHLDIDAFNQQAFSFLMSVKTAAEPGIRSFGGDPDDFDYCISVGTDTELESIEVSPGVAIPLMRSSNGLGATCERAEEIRSIMLSDEPKLWAAREESRRVAWLAPHDAYAEDLTDSMLPTLKWYVYLVALYRGGNLLPDNYHFAVRAPALTSDAPIPVPFETPTETPTPDVSSTPTPFPTVETPVPTPSLEPTATAEPTDTAEPTATSSPIATETPSDTATPDFTNTPNDTATPLSTPSAIASNTPEPSATANFTVTHAATATAPSTPTSLPTRVVPTAEPEPSIEPSPTIPPTVPAATNSPTVVSTPPPPAKTPIVEVVDL